MTGDVTNLLVTELAKVLGGPVTHMRSLEGGISATSELLLDDGRSVVLRRSDDGGGKICP